MSRRRRAPLRAHNHPPRGAALVSAFAITLIGAGAVGVSAGSPPGALQLSAEQARAAGLGLSVVPRPELAPGLVELAPDSGVSGTASRAEPPRLLAVAPAGDTVATADRIGRDPAVLSIVDSDGSQVRVDLPGVLAAAFASDASWLAVADGAGQLWRVGAADGSRRLIASGPFIGPLSVNPANEVLALAVPSIEAPFESRLVQVEVDTGASKQLSDELLVYGATPLADGGVAVVAHRPGGTVVQVVRGTRATMLADLGTGAVNVTVAAGGNVIAWERSGAVYLLDISNGRARRLGPGSNPSFSPDGATLLVDDGAVTRLFGTDGSELATLDGPAGFIGCGEGCGS